MQARRSAQPGSGQPFSKHSSSAGPGGQPPSHQVSQPGVTPVQQFMANGYTAAAFGVASALQQLSQLPAPAQPPPLPPPPPPPPRLASGSGSSGLVFVLPQAKPSTTESSERWRSTVPE